MAPSTDRMSTDGGAGATNELVNLFHGVSVGTPVPIEGMLSGKHNLHKKEVWSIINLQFSSLFGPNMASTIQDTPSTSTLEKRNGSDDLAGDIEDPEARKMLEKKLLRKIDLRMSILVIIYILNYIDRSNAASARLRGFEEDLGLHGNQFATILAIYFVGYILMQVPSNMFLNYVKKPSWHLPGSMILWGLISVLTGVTKDFVGVLLCRFFLGFVEAAFFPGALLLLSRWYKREEMGFRTAILFCGLLVSLAFGSLIASGILDTMQGKLGYSAWRWLYFIEGAITIAVAIMAIFILPDFPESSASWLSPAEQALAIQRMREDAKSNIHGEYVSEYVGFKMAISDWKIWWLSVTYAAIFLSISFNAYFPTLTATLGYNTTISLLLVAPPPIFVAIVSFFYARHSDRTKERFWHIAIAFSVGIVGYIIVISTMNKGARYAGLFLVACVSAGYIVFLAWISNSIPEPPAKRAVGLAFMSAFAQLGAIGGSYIFPKEWGPTYRNSFGISLGASGLVIVMCYIFKLHLESLNRKAQAEEEARGQKEPGFRYIV